ncbi:hypothetical protein FBUS_10370 [Fasciolopsis buskii]|uniref:Uncharacterized protein n=1 Tax=Fasciolopsis buskii TaxID=27845 RepID=A0A8E0VHW3_9TREM|nr:hypothetical protein FBUS_10370 [Fasciolopsis buski]
MRDADLCSVKEPIQLTGLTSSEFTDQSEDPFSVGHIECLDLGSDSDAGGRSGRHFWSLRFPSLRKPKVLGAAVDTDVDSGIGVAETAGTTRTVSTDNLYSRLGSPLEVEAGSVVHTSHGAPQIDIKVKPESRSTLPRWFRPGKGKLMKSSDKSSDMESTAFSKDVAGVHLIARHSKGKHDQSVKASSEKVKKPRKVKHPFGKKKKTKSKHIDRSPHVSVDDSGEEKPLPRIPSTKSKDLLVRQTWHGADDKNGHSEEPTEPPTLPPSPSGINIQPILLDQFATFDVRRRGTSDSGKRRPWSTLELPPPGCTFVNDDYLFPDALTPTKIPSFRGSKDVVYNVPYMDDKALPPDEPEWPVGESRRTLLSQRSDSIVRIAAEEESSIISLDEDHGGTTESKSKSKRVIGSSKKDVKSPKKKKNSDSQKTKDSKGKRSRSKSSGRFTALFSKTPRRCES